MVVDEKKIENQHDFFDIEKPINTFFDYEEIQYEPTLNLLENEITFKKCLNKESRFEDMGIIEGIDTEENEILF